jgi:hypothetical protein
MAKSPVASDSTRDTIPAYSLKLSRRLFGLSSCFLSWLVVSVSLLMFSTISSCRTPEYLRRRIRRVYVRQPHRRGNLGANVVAAIVPQMPENRIANANVLYIIHYPVVAFSIRHLVARCAIKSGNPMKTASRKMSPWLAPSTISPANSGYNLFSGRPRNPPSSTTAPLKNANPPSSK